MRTRAGAGDLANGRRSCGSAVVREGDETDRWGRPVSVSLEEGGDPDEQGPLISGRVRESARAVRAGERSRAVLGRIQAGRQFSTVHFFFFLFV